MNHVITNTRLVTVAGKPKGEVYSRHSRWHWLADKRGVETWPRSATLADVRAFIARVCLAAPADVKIGRPKWMTSE